MGQPEIFREPILKKTIQRLADEEFENMIKFVVDVEEEIICAGGGLHSDEERLLLEDGSQQDHLWGANFYLERPFEQRYEYTSMINIRPRDGNRSQLIASPELCKKISDLADTFFKSFYEKP
jgi:shikimate kinase